MSDWERELREFAGALGLRARRLFGAIERAVDRDPYHAVGYRGYGTRERVLVLGRVMQNERIAPADAAHSDWRNLVAMLHRLEADPLPFARVRAQLHGASRELEADNEGFLRGWLEPPASLPTARWHEVGLELPYPSAAAPTRSIAHVLTPPSSAAFGVVSDMDDTVLQSEVTNFLRAARMLLLENARTRLPFSGVAAFYRALEAGGEGQAGNPIFYVSSSPWNLYDVIADFLEAQAIPTGPLLLRDWDLGSSLARHRGHKTELIRNILETFPTLPFILVGDSSQEDPEIYSAIVREHPKRILAVYIRNVASNPGRAAAVQRLADEVRAAGSTMVVADDTLTVARHAAAHGWINPAALAEIGSEKRADEGTSGEKVETPGVEQTDATPTVVVDDEVRRGDLE